MSSMSTSSTIAAAAAIVVVSVLVAVVLRRLLTRLSRAWGGDIRSPRRFTLEFTRDLVPPLIVLASLIVALEMHDTLPISESAAHTIEAVAVTLIITLALTRVLAKLVEAMTHTIAGPKGSVSIFATLTRAIVFCIGFLIILEDVGVHIGPLLGALGIGALAIALALQETLANLFSGIHILASKAVQPGDYVRLDSGEEGWVSDVSWRTTTIEELPGNFVIVPNRKFDDAILTNFHRPHQHMSVLVNVGVSYDSDLEHVERIALEVAGKVMHELEVGVPDAEPAVRFHTFAEYSIDLRVILRTRQYADQYILVSEFIKSLHLRFREEGITIPYPILTVEPSAARV